jgi:hypothetical protein
MGSTSGILAPVAHPVRFLAKTPYRRQARKFLACRGEQKCKAIVTHVGTSIGPSVVGADGRAFMAW